VAVTVVLKDAHLKVVAILLLLTKELGVLTIGKAHALLTFAIFIAFEVAIAVASKTNPGIFELLTGDLLVAVVIEFIDFFECLYNFSVCEHLRVCHVESGIILN
jgi:hypothetical protein